MALLRYGGALMHPLTNDADCCCDAASVSCPDCCLQISNGALVADGDIPGTDGHITYFIDNGTASMEVRVFTERSTNTPFGVNPRVVCDTEIIKVEFTFTFDPDATVIPVDAYAVWDALWSRVGTTTPAPNGVDASDTRTSVYWGDTETSLTYSIELRLAICHAKNGHRISVGSTALGLAIDIEIALCPQPPSCCDGGAACRPCCFIINTGVDGWSFNNFEFRWERYDEGPNFGIFSYLPNVSQDGLICIPDCVTIFIEITSEAKHFTRDAVFDVLFDTKWPLCEATGDNPPRPVGWVGLVEWVDEPHRTFSLIAGPSCETGFPEGQIDWTVTETFLFNESVTQGILFSPCDLSCCCCPDACCHDCHFPVQDEQCLELLPGNYEVGGRTQIKNFKTEVTLNPGIDVCGNGGNHTALTFEQDGVSEHATLCRTFCVDQSLTCRESRCFFLINVKMTAPNCGPPVLLPFIIAYRGAGVWDVTDDGSLSSFFGSGYRYWVDGVTSDSGDCDGASRTGTFNRLYSPLFPPRVFGWTTSFDVDRDLDANSPTCE